MPLLLKKMTAKLEMTRRTAPQAKTQQKSPYIM